MAMQSRSDQIQAYQFFMQRVISGLVAKESDPAELPYRRLGWSGFGAVMLTALLTAGFGVYGILVGGAATAWRDGAAAIVEKETGAAYIFRDDRLHPMLNVTSAQLAVGGGGKITRVSAKSLAGVPRGVLLGIPGAPVRIPGGGDLLTGDWSLCTQQLPDGRGGVETVSVLGVGRYPAGGAPLAGGRAAVVDDADGLSLVWNGHRFPIADADPVLRALGTDRGSALPVAPAWLDTLPVGDPLAVPAVSGRGGAGDAFGGAGPAGVRVGQVLAGAGTHYLVQRTELVELTELQVDVVLSHPPTAKAYPDGPPAVREAGAGELAEATIVGLPERSAASPPVARPELVGVGPDGAAGAAVCARFPPGDSVPELLAGARLPAEWGWLATPGYGEQGTPLADQVVVAGGSGALVRTMASPDAAGGSLYLVTDQGIRYALPATDVAGALGLPLDKVVAMPAGLVARLPAGPALDPAAATEPALS